MWRGSGEVETGASGVLRIEPAEKHDDFAGHPSVQQQP